MKKDKAEELRRAVREFLDEIPYVPLYTSAEGHARVARLRREVEKLSGWRPKRTEER